MNTGRDVLLRFPRPELAYPLPDHRPALWSPTLVRTWQIIDQIVTRRGLPSEALSDTWPASTSARFERFVEAEPMSGCWLWIGHITRTGYGQFTIWRPMLGLKTYRAHRVAYELYKGPIPVGLQLDHLCRMKSCVNPSHLEPVSARVNVLRGDTITARNAVATHCSRGHLLIAENLRPRPSRPGRRECLVCYRLTTNRSLNRRRNALRLEGTFCSKCRWKCTGQHRARKQSPAMVGEKNGHAKLTRAQVLEIRLRRGTGECLDVLAVAYTINRSHVWRLTSGKAWAHI